MLDAIGGGSRGKRSVARLIVAVGMLVVMFGNIAMLPAAAQNSPKSAGSASVNGIQVDAGNNQTCGIRTDGTVACWGENGNGQLNGIPSGAFIQVSAGGLHSCALRADGTAACWGYNSSGQASPPADTFTQISAGGFHTCGIKTDETLKCWGSNLYGQAIAPSGTFNQVSAGYDHTCAIRTDGTVACWGYNVSGQVSPPTGTFSQVSAGFLHTCGIKTDGTLVCWGDNEFGEANVPTGIFTEVGSGDYYACGLRADGTIACWGGDSNGDTANYPEGSFTQLSVGNAHACVVANDDTLKCWGFSFYGQLGADATITSDPLAASIGPVSFTHTFSTTGIPAPTFSVTSGSLPPGLALDPSSGVLSGIPLDSGTFTGTITADNGFFAPGSQDFTITVLPFEATPQATLALTNANNPRVYAYVFTGWSKSRSSGFLTYRDGNVSLSHASLLSLTVVGTQAVLHGSALLGDGTPVAFTLEARADYPNPTVRLYLSNGYDSGDQAVSFLRISPSP